MKYLFLGGSRDGQWHKVEHEYRAIEVAAEHPLRHERLPDAATLELSKPIFFELYNYRRLCDFDGANYIVFQFADDTLCPIARLIAGYKPNG